MGPREGKPWDWIMCEVFSCGALSGPCPRGATGSVYLLGFLMCRCPAQGVVETTEEHRKLHFTFLNHMSPRGLVGLTKEGVHMVTTGEFTTTQACLANAGGILEAMAAYMDPLYEKIQVARVEHVDTLETTTTTSYWSRSNFLISPWHQKLGHWQF